MIVYLPILVALAGLIMFLVSKANADVRELGRIMFAAGTLAALLTLPHVVKVLP